MSGAPPTRLRWAVDAGAWRPSDAELEWLLSLLPAGEAAAARAFRAPADVRRAALSRLLARAAAAAALGLPHAAVDVARTKGGKPYVVRPPRPGGGGGAADDAAADDAAAAADAPNWNFSVSHEGDYVVLAAEPLAVVGVDIAAPRPPRRAPGQTLEAALGAFREQLTPREWAGIFGGGGGGGGGDSAAADEAAQDAAFRRVWALKEAYAKATGEGLGARLARAEFDVAPPPAGAPPRGAWTARLALDGAPRPDWAFFLHPLARGHWAAVARAPVGAVVDAWGGFRATFRRPAPGAAAHAAALAEREPPFEVLPVCALVPAARLGEYEAAGGDVL